jgi:hypothetical protein
MTKWYLSARDNATLHTVAYGIENDFENFTCVLKDKRPCTWRLQLRRESPFAKYFLPNASDMGLKNGLLFQVDNEDGQGVLQVLSGPQTSVNPRRDQENTGLVIATGGCGLWYLSKRLALPTPHFPYPYMVTSAASMLPATFEPNWYTISAPANTKRFYLCNETGVPGTAVDVMGLGNGTYSSPLTIVLGDPSLIDDYRTSVRFASGYLDVPTSGLASGNNSWSVCAWMQPNSYPASTMNVFGLGANPAAASKTVSLYVDSSGLPHIATQGIGNVAGATALSLGKPHLLVATWDGTTLRGYLDRAQFATQTPGALNVTYGVMRFGAFVDGTSSWLGNGQMLGFYNGVISAADIANMYAVGMSRHNYLAYDTFSLNKASTQILYYTQRNVGASGGLPYGLAWPQAQIGASRDRRAPNLAMPTVDPNLGSTIYGTARFDNLLDLDGALAVQSTPELTFKTTQSGNALVFSVSGFRDQSATAIFSPDRGNVSDYSWVEGVPPGNHIIAGGQNLTPGNLTNRMFAEGGNDTTAAAFGFATEEFVDARNQDTTNGLTTAMSGALTADGAIPLNINATLVDQPGMLYFMGPGDKGYQMGDIVQIVVDGYIVKQPIRQIEIDLEPGQVATITPVVGTPDAAIMQEFSQLQQNAAAQGVVIKNLSTNY